jgi:hypothetical protein
MSSLPQLFESTSLSKGDGCYEVSIYQPNKPTQDVLAWALKTLQACYPDTNAMVFEIILERLKSNEWGNDKIKDAINHLIETHVYKTINPANILTFDRKRKLYSYNQMIDMVNKYGSEVWNRYGKEKINGKNWFYEI